MAEPRTARSRRTRTNLVLAVQAQLRESGTFNAEAIADAASCSVATFYTHFPTKDDALAQAFDLTIREMVTAALTWLDIDVLRRIGFEKLSQQLVRQTISFFGREQLTLRVGLARLPESKVVRDVYRAADQELLEGITTFICAGQDEGHFVAGDPAAMATTLLVYAQALNSAHVLRAGVPEESILRYAAGLRALLTA